MSVPCEMNGEKDKHGCQKGKCEVQILCFDEKPCVVGDVLNDLRSDLMGELGAINQYSEHIMKWKERCPEAAALLCEIMNDEKTHVAELLKLIAQLDPTQAQKLKEVGCPFRS